MIRYITVLFGLFVLFILFDLSNPGIWIRTDAVETVKGYKIKQVALNHSLEQVTSILGKPFALRLSNGIHKIECPNPKPLDIDIDNSTDIRKLITEYHADTNFCCEANRDDVPNKHVTFIYTRPVSLSMAYPMLWVHFDSSYQVNSVYLKLYEGFFLTEGTGIYGLSFDYDIHNNKTGKINRGVDEEKLKKCFR